MNFGWRLPFLPSGDNDYCCKLNSIVSHILVLFLFTFVILSTDFRTINQQTNEWYGIRRPTAHIHMQCTLHMCVYVRSTGKSWYIPHLHIWNFLWANPIFGSHHHHHWISQTAKIGSIRLFCCSVIIYPCINDIVPIETLQRIRLYNFWYIYMIVKLENGIYSTTL